jgi:hypothetical protein
LGKNQAEEKDVSGQFLVILYEIRPQIGINIYAAGGKISDFHFIISN